MNTVNSPSTTRREFLKTSSKAVAGAALATAVARPGYTAEDNTIPIALIGCGGRGTGAAAQALSTQGPVKLVAVADVFENRMKNSLKELQRQRGAQVDVPLDRQFLGLDAYKKAMEAVGPGGVVLLTTPPAFRPIHFSHAVNNNLHVFMEKSFAVDAPGIRRVLKTGEEATKRNLKVAGGLMSRHSQSLADAIAQIHDGLIGEVITAWAYRMHGPVGVSGKQPGMGEVPYQISNYSCFTWLNGSFIVDWLIHNIDVCCWVKNAWPVSVQGMGGRQVRTDADQLFDHYAAEYTFADGTRLMAQGRHMNNCFDFFGDVIHGAKGAAVLGEGITRPLIYKSHRVANDNIAWQPTKPSRDAYQVEHDLLFAAIRNDQPYNETERCAKSCFTAIMGRMACESGKMLTWDDAFKSNLELAPNLEKLSLDGPPPASATPNEKGAYPVAMPGKTPVI